MTTNDYSKLDRDIININHKIDSLKTEIESGGLLPNSVKSILQEANLIGIHNTIGNVISTDEKYLKALDIATSSNKNFIITEDETSSKQAINYLKDNHLGRATFFPLSVIKERYIDSNTLEQIKNSSNFIGVLSDLVEYDNKYKNIIKNQLGIVLVSKDLNTSTMLGHMINNKYKIVSLDGDVINVGGSLTGGSSYKSKSPIILKQEYNNLSIKKKILKKKWIS